MPNADRVALLHSTQQLVRKPLAFDIRQEGMRVEAVDDRSRM